MLISQWIKCVDWVDHIGVRPQCGIERVRHRKERGIRGADKSWKQLESVTEKWSGQYPSAMNRWHENWDAISPIFKFSKEVRTAFYTTNAIESLNSCYRRLNKQRSVFPSSQALMKALYLGTFEIAKKWTMPIRNWGKVRGELEIMYPDRMQI